ncbi:unnamed protein product, partial [Urochloa humidicola]
NQSEDKYEDSFIDDQATPTAEFTQTEQGRRNSDDMMGFYRNHCLLSPQWFYPQDTSMSLTILLLGLEMQAVHQGLGIILLKLQKSFKHIIPWTQVHHTNKVYWEEPVLSRINVRQLSRIVNHQLNWIAESGS